MSQRDARIELGPHEERRLLVALLIGNFVIGSAILLPAGMLTEVSHAFSVDVATGGRLMLVSGVTVALGAPLVAALTSHIDRRTILAGSLLIYVAAHLASIVAPSFDALLGARVAIGIGAAVFTPQAAATVGALLPPERRASAITFAFIGWSLASIGGVPMGGLIAHTFGWQAAFAVVGASAAAALAGVLLTVPRGVRIAPLSLASWREVATSPALLLVLLVTVLNGSGQFTLFTYLAPSLNHSLGASSGLLTGVLAWFGLWATAGNVMASRVVGRVGVDRAVLLTLVCMTAALVLWGAGAGAGSLLVVLAAAALWGMGNFATNSMQQARLAGLRPTLASASIALNTSAIYVGQAIGAATGAELIRAGSLGSLPYAGAGLLVCAAVVSVAASRRTR